MGVGWSDERGVEVVLYRRAGVSKVINKGGRR